VIVTTPLPARTPATSVAPAAAAVRPDPPPLPARWSLLVPPTPPPPKEPPHRHPVARSVPTVAVTRRCVGAARTASEPVEPPKEVAVSRPGPIGRLRLPCPVAVRDHELGSSLVLWAVPK
jgi:hypothetical protein